MNLKISSAKLSKLQRLGLALLLGSNLGMAQLFVNPHNAMAGVITLPDGGRCEGELSDGKLSGPGTFQPTFRTLTVTWGWRWVLWQQLVAFAQSFWV
jgi:hypothetical protein